MKLVRCLVPDSDRIQVGIQVGDAIVPVGKCLEGSHDGHPASNMIDFLRLPQKVRNQAHAQGKELAGAGLGYSLSAVRLLAPVHRPGKFIGLGYNYKALCEYENVKPGKTPELFVKLVTSVVGPFDPVEVPKVIDKVDYEAELGVVIGRYCRNVPRAKALDCVAGYTLVNDITAKVIPRPPESGSVVLSLKGVDTFAPTGPCLVTADEIKDPQNLTLLCRVNGEQKQEFSTSDMVFSIAEVIAYLTERITLEPGDMITTGTSLGIGIILKPPVFLKDHDVVEIEAREIGTIRNPFSIPALR